MGRGAAILRDMRLRYAAAEAEPMRRTLKYICHNTTFSPQVRAQAALDLTRMNGDTRPVRIQNRCVITGNARSVLRAFKLHRSMFRDMALDGDLPGVQKGSW